MTQTKHVTPAQGLESLAPLVGKWHTEGELLEGPFGPAAPFAGVETYEWLEGGHFLIHRLEGHFGSRPAACVEVLGLENGKLVARSYYDDGKQREWLLAPRKDGFELSASKGDESQGVRCELHLVEAGHALEATWSHQQGPGDRREFLRTRATKALPLPTTSVGT